MYQLMPMDRTMLPHTQSAIMLHTESKVTFKLSQGLAIMPFDRPYMISY